MSLSSLFVLSPTLSTQCPQHSSAVIKHPQQQPEGIPLSFHSSRSVLLLSWYSSAHPWVYPEWWHWELLQGHMKAKSWQIRGSCPCTDGLPKHQRFYSPRWDFSKSHSSASVLTQMWGHIPAGADKTEVKQSC